MSRNGQAQPDPVFRGALAPVEFLEDMLGVIRADAGSGIIDG